MKEKEELLQSLYEYLPKLYSGINTNVEYYRTNQNGMADELIIQVIDGLCWTIDAIILSEEFDREGLNIQELKNVLSEMLLALENEDKVLIADILEYEIMPQVKKWFHILQGAMDIK